MGQVGVVLSLQKCRADRIPYGIHQQFGARVIRELQCDAVRDAIGPTLLNRQYITDLSHENVIRVIPRR